MEADLRELAARLGAEVVAVHIDDGISGAVRDRPEFVAWLDDAREGRADVLAAWAVDRMTREGLPVAAMMLDVLEQTGVRLVDYSGLDSQGDQSSFRLTFVIKAELARAERERMRDRARARGRRQREAGRWGSGVPPYGYRVATAPDGRGAVLVIDEAEAANVREAADRVLSGEPLGRVVKAFNLTGIRPKRAAAWTHTSLWKVLTGDAVRGHRRHGGQLIRDADGYPVEHWRPILTGAKATELRRVLTLTERAPTLRSSSRLLTGLATCAGCGKQMRVGMSKGAVRYGCKSAPGACPAVATVSARDLEAFVAEAFLSKFGAWPLCERRVLPAEDADELARVNDAVAAALRELATDATAEAFGRLQSLQARQRELEARPTAARYELAPTGRTLAEEWQARDGDTEAQRALLTEYLAAVEVSRAGYGKRLANHPERVQLVPRELPEDDAADLDDEAV